MLTIPGIAAAAYAFWKGHAQLLAVSLFIAHVRYCLHSLGRYHIGREALAMRCIRGHAMAHHRTVQQRISAATSPQSFGSCDQ